MGRREEAKQGRLPDPSLVLFLLVPGFGPDPCGGLNFHRKERVRVLLILGGNARGRGGEGFLPLWSQDGLLWLLWQEEPLINRGREELETPVPWNVMLMSFCFSLGLRARGGILAVWSSRAPGFSTCQEGSSEKSTLQSVKTRIIKLQSESSEAWAWLCTFLLLFASH